MPGAMAGRMAGGSYVALCAPSRCRVLLPVVMPYVVPVVAWRASCGLCAYRGLCRAVCRGVIVVCYGVPCHVVPCYVVCCVMWVRDL